MDTTYDLMIKKLSMLAGAKKIPLIGTFELTSRCNLNCRMCYLHDPEKDSSLIDRELTSEQWIKLALEARDNGLLGLILTGGEIFLRNDFRIIYENIATMGFNITLYTNGSLIDDKKAKWLGKIPPASVEITLYGASADTYGRLCGNAGAYERVMRAVDLLLAEGINVELRTTVTNYNTNDFEALAEFSFKRGIPLDIVNYLYPARSSSNMANACRLSPEELVDFQASVIKISERLSEIYAKSYISSKPPECASKLMREIEEMPVDPQRAESAFGCEAGRSGFWITWDGRMLPCATMEEPVARPLETGFKNAWEQLTMECEGIPASKECRECELSAYCMVCPARLKSETGYYDRPAPYLCDMARISKEKLFSLEDKNH